jgi:hypothetical protein
MPLFFRARLYTATERGFIGRSLYGVGGRDTSRPYIPLSLPKYFTSNSSERESLLIFLAVEFLFYLWNTISEAIEYARKQV